MTTAQPASAEILGRARGSDAPGEVYEAWLAATQILQVARKAAKP